MGLKKPPVLGRGGNSMISCVIWRVSVYKCLPDVCVCILKIYISSSQPGIWFSVCRRRQSWSFSSGWLLTASVLRPTNIHPRTYLCREHLPLCMEIVKDSGIASWGGRGFPAGPTRSWWKGSMNWIQGPDHTDLSLCERIPFVATFRFLESHGQ